MNTADKKRAEKIKADLETAIEQKDKDKFQEAYKKTLSHYYMRADERKDYYYRFLRAMSNEKNNTK